MSSGEFSVHDITGDGYIKMKLESFPYQHIHKQMVVIQKLLEALAY